MSQPLKKHPIMAYLFNVLSIIGMLLALAATVLIIAFLAMELITGKENPYLGMLVYFGFPGMLIAGLILIPVGAFLRRNKLRSSGQLEVPAMPTIDFNDMHQLRLSVFFVVATFVFVAIVGIASIKGFEFTESTTFCGELCHVVMAPEHTAWSNSPHAKVKCVECHVGPGAEWYVKAKISGLRQVWAVLTHSWPTPIHTPIENLRPARDTCEHCHWTEKFYSGRQKVFSHFAPNEQNTAREVNLLINIGGSPKNPKASGIHWHMGTEIDYISTDPKRMEIPYVKVKQKDGSFIEYMSTEKPLTREEIAKAIIRPMDCTDCHNRPTHVYRSPSQEMDEHIVSRSINGKLPWVKKVAVDILSAKYATKPEAFKAIETGIPAFYAKNYPQLAKEMDKDIQETVKQVKDIYSRNFFPEMKVTWATYPNHIGHFYAPGCFRCHDDKHKTSAGKIISKDCNLCHTVLSQTQENIPAGAKVTQFVHPVDIGDEIYKTNCSDCHFAGGTDEHADNKAEKKAKH